MKSQELKKFHLPDAPGVYFWKKGKTILYVGRATSLADRVRSYFSSDIIITRGPNILDMVTLSETIEYTQTDSVLEAIILEANLIKKYQPKYNTKEKDNKSFYQVIITDETYPRVMIVRARDLAIMEITGRISRINFTGKIKYTFGPYPNGKILRNALNIIRKIFPFRDAKSDDITHARFYKQLGLLPETGDHDLRTAYMRNIQHVKLFFQGKKNRVRELLTSDMKRCIRTEQFEQAALIRNKLFALNHINDIALIGDNIIETSNVDRFRIESYDIAHMSGKNTVGVMTVVTDGRVDKSAYRKFKIKTLATGAINDYASLAEIVTRRLQHTEWPLPSIFVVDGGIGQYNAVQQVLTDAGVTIPVVSVIKDSRHKPKAFHGNTSLIRKHKSAILLANSESHRFAIEYHTLLRGKDFITK